MNFEDNIKDKLESRRIEPTASAWDRIEGKLEAAEGKKKNKVVLWTGIAASFIAGVFITMLLFNTETQNTEGDLVVTPEGNEISREIEKSFKVPVLEESQVVTANTEKTEATVTGQNPGVIDPVVNNREQNKKTQDTNSKIIKTQTGIAYTNQKEKAIESKQLEKNIETTIDNKINEVVTSVATEVVVDQEVDALLLKAQREIVSARVLNTERTKLSANELLLDAEAEVDPETFKDKIFTTLKSGFNKAVEAVANKDN